MSNIPEKRQLTQSFRSSTVSIKSSKTGHGVSGGFGRRWGATNAGGRSCRKYPGCRPRGRPEPANHGSARPKDWALAAAKTCRAPREANEVKQVFTCFTKECYGENNAPSAGALALAGSGPAGSCGAARNLYALLLPSVLMNGTWLGSI